MTFAIEHLFTIWPWLPPTLLIAGSIAIICTIIEYRKRIKTTLTNYLILSAIIAYIGIIAIGKPLIYLTQIGHLIDNITLIFLTIGLTLVALMDELPMPIRNNLYKKLQPSTSYPDNAVASRSSSKFPSEFSREFFFEDEDHFNAVAEESFPSFEELIA